MTERVGRSNLVEANAKIGVSDSAAQLVGPGIAGALIQWLTAPFAILLDALSFLLSAWILRGIRSGPNDAPKMRASSVGAEIREGLSAIWRNAVLRALAWAIAVWQIFRHASLAIVVLYAARELGFSAGHVGALWMLAGIGSPAVATAPFGGLAGGWIAEHAGLRATLLLAGLGAILLVPLVAWASPLLRLRTLDEAQEPRQTESLAEEMAG